MKEPHKDTHSSRKSEYRSLFSLRNSCVALSLISLLNASPVHASDKNADLNLASTSMTLEELIKNVEDQTDFLFVYNKDEINTSSLVSVVSASSSVQKCLEEVSGALNISYVIDNDYIVLKSSENAVVQKSQQQVKKIRGTVVDPSGIPIIGANVIEKGTNKGVITDFDGNFTIEVNPGGVIEVSYIGYVPQNVKVDNKSDLNIVLHEDTQKLDEVVVVGFGTQKKVNLTGSVSTVNSKQLESRPVANVSQALQGLVPGLNFSYAGNGGEINNDMKMNIRGNGTIGAGSNSAPLVLIDGMEGDMNSLNPQDIENISVLKDAAASSIYGSRAPFGVILITTKTGKAGRVAINYNNSFRWSKATNMPNVADSYTYASYFNRASVNNGEQASFNAEQMERIKNYQNGTFLPTTVPENNNPSRWDWVGNSDNDWYDIYFGRTAFSQEHSLSVNGGTEKYQYYVSGNYMDQNGLMRFDPDNLKRYNVTAKINTTLNSWLSMNYSSRFTRKDYEKSSFLNDNTFYHNIAKRWPMEPHYDPNGHLYSMANYIENGGRDNTQTDWIAQQLQVVAEPIKGWKIFGELNYKIIDTFRHTDYLRVARYDTQGEVYFDGNETSSVTEFADRSNFFNPNVYTEYLKEFSGGHTLKAMAGFQAEKNKYRKIKMTKNDLITNSVPSINAATGADKINESRLSHWATAGFFARINYDYQGRYLVEFNGRYDGTSRFGEDKRWNFFPSVSAGWNIAREAFMESLSETIGTLKLRGSWGELGNQNTELLYPYIQLMKFVAADPDSHWLVNNKRPNTSNAPNLISATLGWETMRSWNVGVDFGFFNNRLNMSFDWFNRQTLNMVGPAPELPEILGTTVPRTNNADMMSQGFELDLSWRDRIQDFNYGVHLLLSDDRQKVTRYPNKTGSLSTWRKGQYVGEIWGYQTQGIAKSKEEMDAWLALVDQTQIGSNWDAGDIMYVDLDGDGKINGGSGTISDPGDKRIIGNSTPRFKFGLDLDASWKGFDVRIFLQGVAKRDYWFNDNMFWGASGGKWQSGCFEEHLDFFRPAGDEWGENLNGYFPRPIFDGGKNQQTQTRYLQNAAYLRLKNLQIGYTLPTALTKNLGIQNLRVFFSGENLFTISGLPDSFDPEVLGTGYGTWDGGYTSAKTHPLTRTFSTGFSVNF